MPESSAPRDVLAETMADSRKALVPHLAALLKREKIVEVPPDEERRRFWKRAMTPEQEAQLWTTELATRGLLPEALTPEVATDIGLKIGQQVYPDRYDMMPQDGRDTQAKQANWAWKHAKLGPPETKDEGEAI